MSEELHKFRLEQDKQNCESGKVPNNTEKCFIQGPSCTVHPYTPCLLVQRGKVSPNHKSETSDGDASGIEVVLYILEYMNISSKYTGGEEPRGAVRGFVGANKLKRPYLRRPHYWVQRKRRHCLKIDLEQDRSSIAITLHPVRSV